MIGKQENAKVLYLLYGGITFSLVSCSNFLFFSQTIKETVLGEKYHTFLRKQFTWPGLICKECHNFQKTWHLSTSSFQAACHFIFIFMVPIFLIIWICAWNISSTGKQSCKLTWIDRCHWNQPCSEPWLCLLLLHNKSPYTDSRTFASKTPITLRVTQGFKLLSYK